MAENGDRDGRSVGRTIFSVIVAILGLWLLVFGAWLAVIGGSIYYVLAGIALLASAFLLFRGRSAGLIVYAAVLVATMAWALWEVGFDFWQLAPRGDLLVPLGVLLLLPWVTRGLAPRARITSGAGLVLLLSLVLSGAVAVAALFNHPHDRDVALSGRNVGKVAYAAAPGDWPAYAGTWAGLKWSPLTQITPANIKDLDVAWHYHTGDLKRPSDPGEFTYEMTPIKVGDLLYLCTPHDIVIALDPVTGKTRWRFDPHINVTGTQHMSCRGVS
jgi:quinoprotein glucose dehydrogenase